MRGEDGGGGGEEIVEWRKRWGPEVGQEGKELLKDPRGGGKHSMNKTQRARGLEESMESEGGWVGGQWRRFGVNMQLRKKRETKRTEKSET